MFQNFRQDVRFHESHCVRRCFSTLGVSLYAALFFVLCHRCTAGSDPEVLNALARNNFFHFIEPGFSPFLCTREASYFLHPIIFRVSNVGFWKLHSLQASFLRIDVGVFFIPDEHTGSCPSFPTKPGPKTGWYYSSRTIALSFLQPLENSSSMNTSSAANVVQMDDFRLDWDSSDESKFEKSMSVLLCIWATAAKAQLALPQQKPLSATSRILYILVHGRAQQHHSVCSRDLDAKMVDHLFGSFSFSCSVLGGHWERESASLGPDFWTSIDHEPSLGYSKVSKLGDQSYDVRNMCLHSSGVLLFAPSDHVFDGADSIEHVPLVLLSSMFSTQLKYGFPVTIIQNSTYFAQFEHSVVGLEQPGLLLISGLHRHQIT